LITRETRRKTKNTSDMNLVKDEFLTSNQSVQFCRTTMARTRTAQSRVKGATESPSLKTPLNEKYKCK